MKLLPGNFHGGQYVYLFVVSAWTQLVQEIFPIFTQPTTQVFLRLVTGWILCTGRRTITGIIPFAAPSALRSHDAYHRFFSAARWEPERSFRACADGFYASLAGRKIPRLHLVSRMRSDAAVYELPAPETKVRRGPKRKKGFRLPTPAEFARRIRSWTTVQTVERAKVKERLVHARIILWYKVSHAPVLLAISRDPAGKERDDFFFTTDRTMTPAEVIGTFASRWSIEDTFKNTKQFLGAQEPQSWKRQGPERVAVIGGALSSLAWTWFLRHGYRKNLLASTPWYPAKTHPSFQDALAALRRVLWRERIISMFGHHAVPSRISKFFIAALEKAA